VGRVEGVKVVRGENIKIKTLTPLWTGDIEGKCTKIKETGIIGSLRWWYEALVRGLGGYACDPTSGNSCSLDYKKYKKHIDPGKSEQKALDEQICPACQLFGCTGWKKRFGLVINGGEMVYNRNLDIFNIQPKGRRNGWFFGPGIISKDKNNLMMNITTKKKDYYERDVKLVLGIIQEWGALGARTQIGYGVVNFLNPNNGRKIKIEENKINNFDIKTKNGKNNFLPNLQDFFFAKVNFKVESNEWYKKVDGLKEKQLNNTNVRNSKEIVYNEYSTKNIIPISPAIKNYLRFDVFSNISRNEKKFIFGTIYNRKISTKINISFAYPFNNVNNEWEFRIWGWVPREKLPREFDRERFLVDLHREVEKFNISTVLGDKVNNFSYRWREFNSDRDTKKKTDDIKEFLEENLLKKELK